MIQKFASLVSLLKHDYSMNDPTLGQLSNSAKEITMIVTDGGRKCVLKMFGETETAELVASFQDFLHNRGLRVPCVIAGNDKKITKHHEDRTLVLMEFVEGHGISWDDEGKKLKDELVKSIAQMIARMHLAVLKAENEEKLKPFVGGSSLLPSGEQIYGLNLSQMRKALVHGDLTRENILVSPSYDSVVAIIDFGDASYNYLAYDLAVVLTQVFVTKTWGIDIQGIQSFMAHYNKLNPLFTAEQKALLPFMLYKNSNLIDEIDRWKGTEQADETDYRSMKSSAQAKITLIQNNELQLRQILEVS